VPLEQTPSRHHKEAAIKANLPSQYTFLKGYHKVSAKKIKCKQSVRNSSVPLPTAIEASVTKPASAPVKTHVQPIMFNQYGTNIHMAKAF
jgi:hypothetical protein